jgi:hypothetical protein
MVDTPNWVLGSLVAYNEAQGTNISSLWPNDSITPIASWMKNVIIVLFMDEKRSSQFSLQLVVPHAQLHVIDYRK